MACRYTLEQSKKRTFFFDFWIWKFISNSRVLNFRKNHNSIFSWWEVEKQHFSKLVLFQMARMTFFVRYVHECCGSDFFNILIMSKIYWWNIRLLFAYGPKFGKKHMGQNLGKVCFFNLSDLASVLQVGIGMFTRIVGLIVLYTWLPKLVFQWAGKSDLGPLFEKITWMRDSFKR